MPRVPGQSSRGGGREVAGGLGRRVAERGELWLLLRDGKVLEGFGQRSETCSDLHFNRGVPAADLRTDVRPARELAGAPLRRQLRASNEA